MSDVAVWADAAPSMDKDSSLDDASIYGEGMTDTAKNQTDEGAKDSAGATEPVEGDDVETAGERPIGEAEASAVQDSEDEAIDPVEALRTEVEQVRAQHQRAVADYQNLERRSREERQEVGRYALTDAIRGFLPILDDLERAIDVVERDAGDAAWLEGVRLVVQKFHGVLQQYGVEEIHALGQPFDPNQHEAVGSAAGPDGLVVHLLQRGYVLKDRVVRPAIVMVGNGEDEPGAPPAES
ncbi:MAG: nucleotide exchange factor GrpE [Chloroflexi bacterium]|nr:nucleotide exchange factor GrpE [Chloroflexota bacterium]MQC47581.1 nucleotide exchange factor GrpE [Chloroflexota bacterium]